MKIPILHLMKDPESGYQTLGRSITVLGCIALSFGFYKEAIVNGLTWQDYIGYAVSMTIMYAPSKAIELINAIKGNQTIDLKLDNTTKKV